MPPAMKDAIRVEMIQRAFVSTRSIRFSMASNCFSMASNRLSTLVASILISSRINTSWSRIRLSVSSTLVWRSRSASCSLCSSSCFDSIRASFLSSSSTAIAMSCSFLDEVGVVWATPAFSVADNFTDTQWEVKRKCAMERCRHLKQFVVQKIQIILF